MKKNFCLLIMLFMLFVFDFASANKVAVLPDIFKPDSLTVDNSRVIVTEGASIYLYSMKGFDLQKKFGSPGEGPREFKISSYGGTGLIIDVQPRVFLVTSVGKLSLYTTEGEFIKEMKSSHNFFGNRFLAFGKQYVGLGSITGSNANYMTVNIYNEKLDKVKEVCKWESPYQPGTGTRVFTEPYIFRSTGDKIFTTNGTDFSIDVYGGDGEKLYAIEREYERIRVSEDTERDVIHYFKTGPSTRDVFQYMQPIRFPDYLPAVRNVIVSDGNVYVITFREEDDKTEIYIFDLQGKLLERVFLPLKKQTVLIYFPYEINDGKLYQLVEDEESEEWELHMHELN